jgi:cobalamin biosynthesis Mg chelatase CobN
MIPLTLRAMSETRHHPARSSGRLAAALPLVLALLAFAVFPSLVQADSAGVIYGEAPPTVPGKKKTPTHEDGTPAHSSNTDTGGSTAPGGSGGSGDSGGSSAGSPSTGANDNPSTGGSGEPRQGDQGKASTGSQQGGSVDSRQPVSTAQPDDQSSSSPLVPILIAIAALAAISIGAVVIRQRRQGGGPDAAVSPKVG